VNRVLFVLTFALMPLVSRVFGFGAVGFGAVAEGDCSNRCGTRGLMWAHQGVLRRTRAYYGGLLAHCGALRRTKLSIPTPKTVFYDTGFQSNAVNKPRTANIVKRMARNFPKERFFFISYLLDK